MAEEIIQKIAEKLAYKAGLKQSVYKKTLDSFKELKKVSKMLLNETKQQIVERNTQLSIDYRDKGEFEFELKFGGDTLIILMHTNIFEFPRHHAVMKTPYIKEDISRSYCGVFHIYNFLSDSFKYNRTNDIGYLIARVFINNDMFYMIEGKREIGKSYNHFTQEKFNKKVMSKIIEASILYSVDFDLLTPPYDNIKEVSVAEIQESIYNARMKTGKRLGFKFQADIETSK